MREVHDRQTFSLSLGKVAYTSQRRINSVDLTLELRVGVPTEPALDIDLNPVEQLTEVSIVGNVWNGSHTDIVHGGQCVDTIRELFPRGKRVQRICELWDRWHLNGMEAGTRRQRECLNGQSFTDYAEQCAFLESRGLIDDENYRYGSAWLCEPLPEEVRAELVELFGGNEEGGE